MPLWTFPNPSVSQFRANPRKRGRTSIAIAKLGPTGWAYRVVGGWPSQHGISADWTCEHELNPSLTSCLEISPVVWVRVTLPQVDATINPRAWNWPKIGQYRPPCRKNRILLRTRIISTSRSITSNTFVQGRNRKAHRPLLRTLVRPPP